MTLRAGRVVWDPHGTLMPFWEEPPSATGRCPACSAEPQAPQRCACTRAAICPDVALARPLVAQAVGQHHQHVRPCG